MTTIFDVKKSLVACTKFSVSKGTDKSDFIITYQKNAVYNGIIHNQINTLVKNKNMTYYFDY